MHLAIPFTTTTRLTKNKEAEGAELSISLAVMARECANKLSAYGKTIKDATDFFIEHLAASDKSSTVEKLVDDLVAARQKGGASQSDVDDIRSRLALFAKKFEGRAVGSITGQEIIDWLGSLNVSAVTRNHYQLLIVLAFNFAVQNGYVSNNPVFTRFTSSGDLCASNANGRHLRSLVRHPKTQPRNGLLSTAKIRTDKD